ncbi:MAG: endolytic transglycosylase MltG [Boseongicola sp.]
MWRHLASNALTLIIVALFVAIGGLTWAQSQYAKEGPLVEAICLQVPQGGTINGVASDLLSQEAISNATLFRLGADYSNQAANLKAGSFLVESGASMAEIVDRITGDGLSTCGTEVIYRISVGGQSVRVRELNAVSQEFEVTAEYDPASDEAPKAYSDARQDVATRYRVIVAEGATSWQIVNALNALDLFVGEPEEVPDEGTLAPESYEVRAETDRNELLASMAVLQADRLAQAWDAKSNGAPVKSPEEALVLASIIEKETGLPEERGLVASVFANRLARGIKLQTDPTVIYGVTRGEGILGRGLRQSELRRETPWNTYVIDGLPPTPIANPGLASIEAALNPADSDFIFFVADGTGGHAFAETLDEHNENVARWRRIEAERDN